MEYAELGSRPYRAILSQYFFGTVIGRVVTFLKCTVFGTAVIFSTVLLDISVTFFWNGF